MLVDRSQELEIRLGTFYTIHRKNIFLKSSYVQYILGLDENGCKIISEEGFLFSMKKYVNLHYVHAVIYARKPVTTYDFTTILSYLTFFNSVSARFENPDPNP
jgi:hypothetical protein